MVSLDVLFVIRHLLLLRRLFLDAQLGQRLFNASLFFRVRSEPGRKQDRPHELAHLTNHDSLRRRLIGLFEVHARNVNALEHGGNHSLVKVAVPVRCLVLFQRLVVGRSHETVHGLASPVRHVRQRRRMHRLDNLGAHVPRHGQRRTTALAAVLDKAVKRLCQEARHRIREI